MRRFLKCLLSVPLCDFCTWLLAAPGAYYRFFFFFLNYFASYNEAAGRAGRPSLGLHFGYFPKGLFSLPFGPCGLSGRHPLLGLQAGVWLV
jgi:hypothetical protein